MTANSACDFLRIFTRDKYSFRLISKNAPPKNFLIPKENLERFMSYLTSQNQNGFDVYFTSQESEGTKGTDVSYLQSFFIEADNVPSEILNNFIKDFPFPPSAIIETSNKNYHIYWVIDKVKNTTENRTRWLKIQRCLAYCGTNEVQADEVAMADVARILRVPSFHNKKPERDNFLCYTKHVSSKVYKFEDIEAHFKDKILINNISPSPIDEYRHIPTQYLPDSIGLGKRHALLISRAKLLADSGLGELEIKNELIQLTYKFIEGEVFRQGGNRHEELLKAVRDGFDYSQKEINEKLAETNKAITALDTITKPTVDTPESLELPDEFYFNAPYPVGELTKQITQGARWQLPSASFAVALSLLSIIKSKRVSFDNAPALLYILCLAPTGSGKNYPQEVLSNLTRDLDIDEHLHSDIRSDAGLFRTLEESQSKAVFFFDEVSQLFKGFNNKNTPSYLMGLKENILKFYGSHSTILKRGFVSDASQKTTSLINPHLGMVGFSTPDLLSLLNLEDESNGLLSRFLILMQTNLGLCNKQSIPSRMAVSDDLKKYLRDLYETLNMKVIWEIQNIKRVEFEIEEELKQKKVDKEKLALLRADLNKYREYLARVESTPLQVTEEAREYLSNAEDYYIQKRREQYSKGTYSCVYDRVMENVNRLIAIIAPVDVPVSLEIAQFAHKFIDRQSKVFETQVTPNLGKTRAEKIEEGNTKALAIWFLKQMEIGEIKDYKIRKRVILRTGPNCIRKCQPLLTCLEHLADLECIIPSSDSLLKKGGRGFFILNKELLEQYINS